MTTKKTSNGKCDCNGKCKSWSGSVLHPTLRDQTAKDGAPVHLWQAKENERRQETILCVKCAEG